MVNPMAGNIASIINPLIYAMSITNENSWFGLAKFSKKSLKNLLLYGISMEAKHTWISSNI